MTLAVKGYAATFGLKQATTYRTPVLVGAGDGIEPTSEGLTPDSQFIQSEALTGSRSRSAGDRGNELHSGDMEFELKYEGLELILALALGTAAAPVQQGADDAYLHEFTILDTDLEGQFATLVIDKQLEVWEYPTCKVGSVTISAASGALTMLTATLVPSNLNRNTSSGTNNNTTIGSITVPANRDFLLWEQLAIRLNEQSAGALANADLVYPTEFSITLNSQHVTDDVSTAYGREIDEPLPDGFLEVTGSLNFSRWNETNNKIVNAHFSKTIQKMSAVWTGPIADGATNFELGLYFPSLQIDTLAGNITGPGRAPLNAGLICSKALALPTGFPTGFTGAVGIQLINQRNTQVIT